MHSKYNFKNIEQNRYQNWLNKNYFKTENNVNKKAFTIIIPPPNITGKLHLGHAWNNVLQDIIIRRNKMLGFDVLFLPGMDHAGIATQSKIKTQLKLKGYIENENLTKEVFLQYASIWKEKYSNKIREQWASLGLALDYEYEKFTLDPDLSKVIEKVFIQLFNDNLIYRDYKIINWDVVLQTTLSKTEVNYKMISGQMFYLRYFLINENNKKTDTFVEVATTRPETIFVDQALAINPKDKRYQHLVGRKVIIPNTNIIIPIICDTLVDINFGTGILKVTPAHDETDFLIGKRHKLKAISCINVDGKINEWAPREYQKLDILACRRKLIMDLQAQKLVSKIEHCLHNVGYSTISGSQIEPRLSLQWFLKTKELANFVLQNHKLTFFPNRFLKIFNDWLLNVEDWCISRQLWWGHAIPVWYKENEIKVQSNYPGEGFVQEKDVLDTWFSSSLWPLSVLGWPEINTNLFYRRFPINILVTGYDILNFWVSKMVLQSAYLMQKIPFEKVLLHGLVKDEKGQKMSKSKDNGIDPIEIIEKYGADTLRWFLTTNVPLGADLSFNNQKVISSYHFINKIWNVSRFIILNLKTNQINFELKLLNLPERALLSQFSQLIKKIDLLYENYEFNTIGQYLYNFIWEDLANWFLEFIKNPLKKVNNNVTSLNTHKFLLYVLQNILKLLHPFIPFVTDALYEKIFPNCSILHTSWPIINYKDEQALNIWLDLKKIVIQMRNFRQCYRINSKKLFAVYMEIPEDKKALIIDIKDSLQKLLNASDLYFQQQVDSKQKVFLFIENDISIFLDKVILDSISLKETKNDFINKKQFLLAEIQRSEKILSNQSFLLKANLLKIEEEKSKYQKYLQQYKKLIEENS
ncbi:MAG: valine--tRNA ligase [Vigna little leaf phytoplasma]|nr:valine--tRNA ligase [Vigna little leaf phytoplasma]